MAKKLTGFKTKGMNRDLSVSAFNPEFAFENMNLRLSTNEGNTLLSWVNERGTKRIVLTGNALTGVAIGTAVLNHKLVVFTTDTLLESSEDSISAHDHIYVLEYTDKVGCTMSCKQLYAGNLKFSVKYPLETLVSYESENIQKVYWTDGNNQPRLINIVSDSIRENLDTQFDFIPTLRLKERVYVSKILGGNGMFAPGVIQYAFTYYNKYGQESNIFYTTPLYYISHRDRGASPEDKVDNAFKITVEDVDANFDYLRIYSIQRTSINGTPFVKRIQDIALNGLVLPSETVDIATSATKILVLNADYTENKPVGMVVETPCLGLEKSTHPNLSLRTAEGVVTWGDDSEDNWVIWITKDPIFYNGGSVYCVFQTAGRDRESPKPLKLVTSSNLNVVSYIDTGTSGDSVDPTELLYKGGEMIKAQTFEQKDMTLFLGNLTTNKYHFPKLRQDMKDITIEGTTRMIYPTEVFTEDYIYSNQLTSYADSSHERSVPCAGFKFGDAYRCGVQFQDELGRWSEPVFIKNCLVNFRPSCSGNKIYVPVLKGIIPSTLASKIPSIYKKVRAVVVFPDMQNRLTVCQGVISPTVYTIRHRLKDLDIYAQSSWFFRPLIDTWTDKIDLDKGTVSPSSGRSGGNQPHKFLEYTRRTTNSPSTGGGTKATRASSDGGITPKSKSDPFIKDNDHDGGGTVYDWNSETGTGSGYYYNPTWDGVHNIRQVEIQGQFGSDNMFAVDYDTVTFHSPELEFDTQMAVTDYSPFVGRQVGKAFFEKTFSDINIQTETPRASNGGAGFIHKSFKADKTLGIVSGLFYDDFLINDDNGSGDNKTIGAYEYQHSS